MASQIPPPIPPDDPIHRDLEVSLRRPRTFFNMVLNAIVLVLTVLALFPLFSVLFMLLWRGAGSLNLTALTENPPALGDETGGFANCIVGTLVLVAIASCISVPIGIMGAFYLAEVAPESRLARVLRFLVKVFTGFPSVLAGVFGYGALVVTVGGPNAWAGGLALGILMIPIVTLTAEEAIKAVPLRMKEAAIGMGATPGQVAWTVLFPTAFPTVLTGVMLAVARAAGETAPLIFTAEFTLYWFYPDSQTPSLSYFINWAFNRQDELAQGLAWAAAFILVTLVLTINLIGQSFNKTID